jgi:hypothetical protein
VAGSETPVLGSPGRRAAPGAHPPVQVTLQVTLRAGGSERHLATGWCVPRRVPPEEKSPRSSRAQLCQTSWRRVERATFAAFPMKRAAGPGPSHVKPRRARATTASAAAAESVAPLGTLPSATWMQLPRVVEAIARVSCFTHVACAHARVKPSTLDADGPSGSPKIGELSTQPRGAAPANAAPARHRTVRGALLLPPPSKHRFLFYFIFANSGKL